MQDITDRVALITGASRGIGVFIARRLARENARLALAARDIVALEALVAELRSLNCKAYAYETDITKPEDCERLVERVNHDLGAVQILINNAGIERTAMFEHQSYEMDREVVEVNLLAPMRLVHAVLPGMLKLGSGHIVMIGSLAGFEGLPYAASYAATKAALLTFANSLRMEFHARGVSVSTIIPGFVHGAGMFEDQKVKIGRHDSSWSILGHSSPTEVADAVILAICKDKPEIIVNSVPLRLTLALGKLFPSLGLWLVDRFSRRYTEILAKARAGSS